MKIVHAVYTVKVIPSYHRIIEATITCAKDLQGTLWFNLAWIEKRYLMFFHFNVPTLGLLRVMWIDLKRLCKNPRFFLLW